MEKKVNIDGGESEVSKDRGKGPRNAKTVLGMPLARIWYLAICTHCSCLITDSAFMSVNHDIATAIKTVTRELLAVMVSVGLVLDNSITELRNMCLREPRKRIFRGGMVSIVSYHVSRMHGKS